jgi:hypothetical protein
MSANHKIPRGLRAFVVEDPIFPQSSSNQGQSQKDSYQAACVALAREERRREEDVIKVEQDAAERMRESMQHRIIKEEKARMLQQGGTHPMGGFILEEPVSPVGDDYKEKISQAQESRRADEAALKAEMKVEKRRAYALKSLENQVDEAETVYERLVGDDQPFSDMIGDNPIDMVRKQALTGKGLCVVLDAANVGYSVQQTSVNPGVRSHAHFDPYALKSAIYYFKDLGIEVVAFLPSSHVRLRQSSQRKKENAMMQTDDWEVLNKMVLERLVTLVPADADDDLYILHYARKRCCYVISNDFYNDHIANLMTTNSSMGRSMRLWVNTNRISYVFAHSSTGGLDFMIDPASSLYHAIEYLRAMRGNKPNFTQIDEDIAIQDINDDPTKGLIQGVVRDIMQGIELVTGAVTRIESICTDSDHISPPNIMIRDCVEVGKFVSTQTSHSLERLQNIINELQIKNGIVNL